MNNSGTVEDFNELVNSFVAHQSAEFSNFTSEWKRLNFQYIFSCRTSIVQSLDFVEDSFVIAKTIFLNDSDILHRIGVLYLLYALYFKQPALEYCKIRITFEEWEIFKEFYSEIDNNEDYLQAKLVFWKIFANGGFHFVYMEKIYGFDTYLLKNLKDYKTKRCNKNKSFKQFNNKMCKELKMITDEKCGILTALEILEVGCNEMKEMLELTFKETSNTNTLKLLPQSNVVEDLKKSVNLLLETFTVNDDNIINAIDDTKSYNTTSGTTDVDNALNNSLTDIYDVRCAIKSKAFKRKIDKISYVTPEEDNDELTPCTSAQAKQRDIQINEKKKKQLIYKNNNKNISNLNNTQITDCDVSDDD